MSNTPIPRTYSQLLGSMIGSLISKSGISKLKTGNPILSMLESVSQSQLRTSSDIFQLLASVSLDNATGVALQRIGLDEGVPILGARAAGGFVTISDTSFTKIASFVYAGSPAPIIGTTALNVADATLFPASGSVYIGRGTPNLEGPVAYASKVDNGAYWTLNLSSGTTRFHNLAESVIVAQGGNRTVTAGSIVQTPQASTTFGVRFRTQNSVVLPDGETSIENVYVVAQRVGIIGNVGLGDIKEFASAPFVGATATNPTAFTNGREVENDDDYRNRIRIARQTRTKGTKLTLTSSVLGLFSQTENKSIVSSSYVTRLGVPDTLYIDDGGGYEEATEGVAQDIIVASAEGGEQYFGVDSALPVSKAFLQTSAVAPYALSDGLALAVLVGDKLSTHYFAASDFRNVQAATAFEVSASINGNGNLLFSARTSEDGTKVSIFAKSPTFEYLQIQSTGTNANANDILAFPLNLAETLRLFKNDRLLTKDGAPAIVYSNIFGQWGSLLGDQTLTIAVDFTPAVTYTFTDADFVNFNTGYTAVGNNSLQAWVTVLNGLVPGVTFSVQGPQIQAVSNKGNSALAAVDIQGGSLVSNGAFNTELAEGRNNDYSFDRNIGQIKLTEPLLEGDTLIAGSAETRAFIESGVLDPVTLASDGHLWLGIDSEDFQVVPTGVVNNSALNIEASSSTVFPFWGYLLRISSAGNIFENVLPGDLAILWDPTFDSSLVGAWRVVNAGDDYIEIGKSNAPYKRKNATATVLADGRVLVAGGYATAILGSGILGDNVFYQTLASAEIYDPATNTWTATGRMSSARGEHTATLLADGTVLVVGGSVKSGLNVRESTLATAEIYDPVTGLWAQVATLPAGQQRYGHTANLLTAGPDIDKVLVAGGNTGSADLLTAYLFDPVGSSFAATASMTTARRYHASCDLPDGDILVIGGYSAITSGERFDAATATWSAAGTVGTGRFGGAVVYSPTSGLAEFYGGHTGVGLGVASDTNNLDRYDPGLNTWSAGAASTELRSFMPWVLASTGEIATYGGSGTNLSAEVYDSGANTWATASAPPLDIINDHFTLGAILTGDQVLFSHGAHALTANYDYGAATFATSQIYDIAGDTWALADPALGALTLTNGGLQIVRSAHRATPVTIPAASNYTATSFANEINTQLTAGFADTYKTNQLRLHTNTFDISGDIGLMAADVSGQLLDLPVANAIDSIVGANGSVESLTSEIGFPHRLNIPVSGQTGNIVDLLFAANYDQTISDTSMNLLFTKKQTVLEDESLVAPIDDYDIQNILDYGSSDGFYSPIRSQILSGAVELRQVPELPVSPDEPANSMVPYRFTWQDRLSVLVDQDTASKNYQVPMGRSLLPVGSTYSSTPAFTDGGNGGASLGAAFGYSGLGGGFNFDDFAIAMHSRLLADPGDATRRILWRWSRIGADGDNVRFEYVLADSPDATPSLSLDATADPIVQVKLGSGALIPLVNFNSSLSLGVATPTITNDLANVIVVANLTATSGSVTTNVATITLTLPPGITDHGFLINDGFYYSGDTGGVFPAGKYKVTARTATTISFLFVTPDFGATPLVNATVTMGTAFADFTGMAANDLFRIETTTNFISTQYEGRTYRANAVSAGFDYFTAVARATGFSVTSTLEWGTINSTQNAFAFSNTTDTATTLAAAFTTTGITATVTGTGAGVIDQSTAEYENDGTFYYTFTDGVKYVKTTNIPVLVGNYSFEFKDPINTVLATNSDWANEDVYIIPVTAQNCKDWLSSTAVSGVGNTCSVARSTRGTKVQITTDTPGSAGSVEVLGGTANKSTVTVVGQPLLSDTEDQFSVTTADSDLAGFTAQSAVKVVNTKTVSRETPFTTTTVVSRILANGQIHLSSGGYGTFNKAGEQRISFQKVGDFMLASVNSLLFEETSVFFNDGDWISIQTTPKDGTPASTANNGLFRIIKTDHSGSVFYYNPNGVEETNKYAWITIITGFFGPTSYALPGDILDISSDFLGTGNRGSRPILSVGKAFANSAAGEISRAGATVTVTTLLPHGLAVGDYVRLSPGEDLSAEGYKLVATVPNTVQFTYTEAGVAGASNLPQTWTGLDFQNNKIMVVNNTVPLVSYSGIAALGLEFLKFNIIESTPSTYYKFIKNVIPGLVDPNVSPMVILEGVSYGQFVSEAAGSVLEPLGKFNFPTTISYGLDGYAHSTGLIAEASKVLYGDPQDTATYPGVVAAGNSVEISGPLVKRILFGASIRVQSGVNTKSIITKVKSAVAGVINASAVGEDIAFSDIIEAINRVVGVTAVVVNYPTYNNLNDVIKVQNYEKALVLDAQNDVEITLLGT